MKLANKFNCLICSLILFPWLISCALVKQSSVHEEGQDYLVYRMNFKGDVVNIKNEGEYEDINFFCYDGVEPHIFKFWSSAFLQLDLDKQSYQVKKGITFFGIKLFKRRALFLLSELCSPGVVYFSIVTHKLLK